MKHDESSATGETDQKKQTDGFEVSRRIGNRTFMISGSKGCVSTENLAVFERRPLR
jgi:hypothetical protein